MTQAQYASITLRAILHALQQLNTTASGTSVYSYIERALRNLDARQQETERCYLQMLEQLLEALGQQLPADAPQQVDIQLLRINLGAPLPRHEFDILREQLDAFLQQLRQAQSPGNRALHTALRAVAGSAPATDRGGVPTTTVTTASIPAAGYPPSGTETTSAPMRQPAETSARLEAEEVSPQAMQRVDLTYRHHLDQTRQEIIALQEQLAQQINNVTGLNSQFADLISDSIATLRQENTLEQDFDQTRTATLRRCEAMLEAHRNLTEEFNALQKHLARIETSSQDLDKELTRVHLLSLTDELTGLPNRRALIQRMEDEVARVQRYGSPLVLAIIDLDAFKPVNDRYGHAVGDQVLRDFSQRVLSIFRHHDTVARYGGEEFAVLLPSTDLDGALCALQKVQKRAAEVASTIDDGQNIPMPTFSAGVALYNAGESPDELVKRADMAMYRAKRSGGNRIEIHTMGLKQQGRA